MMSAVGWIALVRLYRSVVTRAEGGRIRSKRARRTAPALESLEPISLLSAGGAAAHRPDLRSHGRTVSHAPHIYGSAVAPAPVTLPTQTLTLGNTLTSFQNLALSPSLNLFNSSLGTLTSVTVSQSAVVQGIITGTNETPNSLVATAVLTGSYQINGLNQPIVEPSQSVTGPAQPVGPYGSGNDTVTSPPLTITNPSTTTYTDPASLAFFTASPGRTMLTATMTASASGSYSGGSFAASTSASASATVSVTYTYTPPACPTAGSIGRIGVHHQRTLLILPFQGVVNPSRAANPADYFVITPAGHRIRIVSASYDPATSSVTLRPARRLNVHHDFTLSAVMPCNNGDTSDVVRIPFGSKYSLVGFHNKRGEFIAVHDGRVVRAELRSELDHHRDA